MDAQLGGKGRVGLRGFDKADLVEIDDAGGQQQIGPQHRHAHALRVDVEIGRRDELEFAPGGLALGIVERIPGRHAKARGQLIGRVKAAEPQVFVEVGKRDRSVAVLPVVQAVDVVRAIRIGRAVGADIADRGFVRRFALRIGIAAAQVDAQIAKAQFAHELGVDQLAFEPGGILVHARKAGLHFAAAGKAALLDRIADEQVGQAQLVAAEFQAHADQRVGDDAVVGNDAFVIGFQLRQVGGRRGLLDRIAVAPLVAEARRGDQPQRRVIAHLDRGASADGGAEVDRQVMHPLQGGAAEAHHLAGDLLAVDRQIVDRAATGEEIGQRRRHIAAAVVEAGPVAARTEIAVAEVAGGLRIAANAGADRQVAFLGHRRGGEVDHAAAEFAGEVGRIALLHQRRCDHVGREDVQRHHAAQRFGAGQRRTVEQRQRIAIAKPAHIDEPAADHAEAGHAAQRAGDVAFTRAGDFGGGQDRDDLIRRLGDVAVTRAGNDDFAGQRNVDRLLLGLLPVLRGSRGVASRRSGVLRQCGTGRHQRRKRGGKQQQGCKPRRNHRNSPGDRMATRGQP